ETLRLTLLQSGLEARTELAQLRDGGGNQVLARGGEAADAQDSRSALLLGGERVLQLLQRTQGRGGPLRDELSRRCRGDRALVALEEAGVQLALEGGDLLGDRGSGVTETTTRVRERTGAHHHEQRAQVDRVQHKEH